MIDSPHTRKEKREKIVALCENAQDIMKDILEKHKNNEVISVRYTYFLYSSLCEVVRSTVHLAIQPHFSVVHTGTVERSVLLGTCIVWTPVSLQTVFGH